MSTATAPGYRHHALLYGTPGQLVDAAVPFLADGLAAGEMVVLTCRPEHNARLAAALGGGDRVLLLESEAIYLRIADAVATYRRLVRQQVAAGLPRVRLVGEVRFDDTPQSWAEWTRYEAICNVALGPLPLSSVCAYDTRELPAPMRRGVEQTHPALLTPTGRRTNPGYLPPAETLRRTAPDPDPLPATPATLHLAALTDTGQLADTRAQLRRALRLTTRHEPLVADFLTAAAEVISNALRHGRPPVDVRLWTNPTRLVCAVTDRGDGFDDPLAGYIPYDDDDQPRAGLWLARRTCDTLHFVATPDGFSALLTTDLPPPTSA